MRNLTRVTTLAAVTALAAFTASVTLSSSPAVADSAPTVSVLSTPVQFAYVSGATLGYRVAGSGQPLVLIAGSSNTMAEWDPRMLDELALTRQVIVFDNRGAGTSTGSVAHLTIAQMARDTAQLIAQVAPDGADVLGWSMGGYIAQALALGAPTRVRRLILASTDCGGPSTIPPTAAALDTLTNPAATQAQRMAILFPPDQMAAAGAWSAAIGVAYAQSDFQPANAFEVRAAVARAQARAAGPQWLSTGKGTCARLGRIRQPTLIAAGEDDIVVPAPNHAALARGIPHHTTRLYSDAGHAFLFQPALGFTHVVEEFLAGD